MTLRTRVPWIVAALAAVAAFVLAPIMVPAAASALGPATADRVTTNGWTTSAEVGAEVDAGTTVSARIVVTSATTRTALIDVELHGGGARPFQQIFDNQSFVAGVPRTYTVYWRVPAAQDPGDYQVKVGVFGLGWRGGLLHWNDSASTFEVVTPTSPSSTAPTTAAPTTAAPTTPAPTACGLAGAAFCETFSAPFDGTTRTGDLDPARWSVGRVVGEVNSTSELQPFPDVPAPSCQAGLTKTKVGSDVVVCDNASGHAGQVLTAVGAQNYGMLSLSPRQAFDFAGRTGTVTYDVDAQTSGVLGWWTSLFITDQPVPVAASSSEVLGYLPRNGLGITFDTNCGSAGKVGVGSVTTYANTVETTIANNNPTCVTAERGRLNRFQVQVSKSKLVVLASDAGSTGTRQIFSANLDLSFSRGYVHLQTAERAPGKYGISPGYTTNYWANVAFDGPVLDTPHVAQVADSLTSAGARGTNVGYPVVAGSSLSLALAGVPSAPSSAVLAFTAQFQYAVNPTLSYRLNGGPVHVAQADVAEQSACDSCPAPVGGSGVGFAVPIDVAELRAGANTIEFTGRGQSGSWPFIIANVDLLTTGADDAPTTTAVPVTTSTVPRTTTTTMAPPASTSTTTSTTASSTSTTAPRTTTTTTTPATTPTLPPGSGGVSGECRIVGAAFCETFGVAAGVHAGLNPRTGDLDPVVWGVSRMGQANDGNGQRNRVGNPTMNVCGSSGAVAPPGDVRVCDGKLYEGVNDDHNVQNLDMYPKQPFDFAGRTGIATFDVSANSEGPHGAWPEWVLTDKPVPGTRSDVSNSGGTSGNNDVLPPTAVHEFGFALDGGCLGRPNTTGVGSMWATRNWAFQGLEFTATDCVVKGDADHLNHFEVRISQNHVEVWGTDPGATALRRLAVADNINLSFTKGLVWINDTHYNAAKFPNPVGQGDHMFVWDNVGFDGPKTYRDIGYDVDDANRSVVAGATDLGYLVGAGSLTLNVNNKGTAQTPTGAIVVLNYWSTSVTPPDLSVNGNPFIATSVPERSGAGWLWGAVAITVPLDQIKPGNNTLTFRSNDGLMQIANISLIHIAGAPVP